MPTYEYKCDACERVETYQLKMDDRNQKVGTECPHCDEGILHRMFSAPNINSRTDIKVDGGFKEVLQRVKARVPKNTIQIRD